MNGKDKPQWEIPLRGKIQSGFLLWRNIVDREFVDFEKNCSDQCGLYKHLQNVTEVRENA